MPYLVRYFIWRPDWLAKIGLNPKKAGRIYLHHILRSDHDRHLHTHPWTFVSVILKGGYWEHKPAGWDGDRMLTKRTYFKAPSILHRPSPSPHRLEVEAGKTTWSLVFAGAKQRQWGFITAPGKLCWWKKYDYRRGICEEPELDVAS